MEQALSPVTRKIVAVGLLVVAILCVINLVIVPIATMLGDSLANLAEARSRRAKLSMISTRPPLIIGTAPSPTSIIHADTPGQATDAMVSTIGEVATRTGATAQAVPGGTDNAAALVVVRLSATGPEANIMELINQLEQGEPAIRFRQWRITTGDTPGAALRFEAEAVAAWAKRR